MKIVLDTNVLVSGLLKMHSNAGKIVRMVAGGSLQLLFDARIINEYREVLNRPKFAFNKKMVEAFIFQIESEGILVSAKPLIWNLPDPDDEAFLEVALTSSDTVIVTGNSKHSPPKLCKPIKVLTPVEFVLLWRRDNNFKGVRRHE